MKLRWSGGLLLAFGLGVFVAFYLTQPENKEKMVFKSPLLETPLSVPESGTDKPSRDAEKALQEHRAKVQATTQTPIPKPEESLQAAEPQKAKKLDLSLPKEWDSSEWKKPVEANYPNFFKPGEMKKFNVSTKFHWDESEEARELPIEKTIEGAELEMQFKLP